jgi:hypothetical protein
VRDKEGNPVRYRAARVLQAVLGVRDRVQHRVEILGLTDPEAKNAPVALYEDATKKKPRLFVTEGGYGLKTGDKVKIEEEKKEPEDKK